MWSIITMIKTAVTMARMRETLTRTFSVFFTKTFVEELIPSLPVQR